MTDADTGQRIVLSNSDFNVVASVGELQTRLADRSVRLSTAVMLSARFPLVSPTAVLRNEGDDPMRLVDGGYFDNSGSATAKDVVTALQSAAERAGLADKIQIIVISVPNFSVAQSSDDFPGEANSESNEENGKSELLRSLIRGGFAGSLLSPVGTLDKIRQRLAIRLTDELRASVEDLHGRMLIVPLEKTDQVDYPLTWTLSKATRDAMHEKIQSLKNDESSDFVAVLKAIDNQ
jgi:predicted acylesterase/phospholipase RssA